MIGQLLSTLLMCGLGQAPAEARFDFKNTKVDLQFFSHETPDVAKYFTPEPEGLRLTLPGKAGPTRAVGIRARQAIHGDFEVTLSYEMLDLEHVTRGFAPGLEIYLMLDNAPEGMPRHQGDGLVIMRRFNREGAPIASFFRMTYDDNKNRVQKNPSYILLDPPVSSGRFRITRRGPESTIAHAQGSEGDDFVEVTRLAIGPEHVRLLRFGANGAGQRVDLRFHYFDMKSLAAPGAAAAPIVVVDAAPPETPRRRVLWVILTALTLLLLAAGGAWFWRAGRT